MTDDRGWHHDQQADASSYRDGSRGIASRRRVWIRQAAFDGEVVPFHDACHRPEHDDFCDNGTAYHRCAYDRSGNRDDSDGRVVRGVLSTLGSPWFRDEHHGHWPWNG